MNDEWLQKNFRGIISELEKNRATNEARHLEIKGLQQTVTMLSQELTVLRTRMNILQHGQVLGSTSGH